jgi:hypothetical protein
MVEIPMKDIPQLYASIMLEIKDRMQWCANALGRAIETESATDKMLEAEACYLNLRRMTELLAIGVVAAHNRDPKFRSTEFTTRNNSDKILHILEKRGGDAFPQPVRIVESEGRIFVEALPDERASMAGSRRNIRDLFVECGKALHTDHLRMMITKDRYRYSSAVIAEAMAHITILLDEHILEFADGKALLTRVGFGSTDPTWSKWADAARAFQ